MLTLNSSGNEAENDSFLVSNIFSSCSNGTDMATVKNGFADPQDDFIYKIQMNGIAPDRYTL
ncbi:hypothetical protein N836_11225 [Leptolyngbya sp. Heron Island J]|nr:hypothetical protein N836_11225 [Leptolyngbya sp. Heron Island J]